MNPLVDPVSHQSMLQGGTPRKMVNECRIKPSHGFSYYNETLKLEKERAGEMAQLLRWLPSQRTQV